MIVGGAGAGIAVQQGLTKATAKGASRGVTGDIVRQRTTATRVRTYVSDGTTITTSGTTTFETTFQRGGGATVIKTTNSAGEETILAGDVGFITNTDGSLTPITRVGTTFLVTNGDVVEETTIFGSPGVITVDGAAIPTTIYEGLTVVTGQDGAMTTSYDAPHSTESSSTTGGGDGGAGT